ncbi:MAG: Hsp20/alpha crystallin family protein [bacterium]
MTKLNDFERSITELRNRMNDMFNNIAEETIYSEPLQKTDWVPDFDVLEDKDDIIVDIDLPGMSAEEINLSISGNVLYVSGERKRKIGREDENYHIIGRNYGNFNTKIRLPASVEPDNTKATYKDGVLNIRLPKSEGKKEFKLYLE